MAAILLIEDDTDLCTLISHTLGASGHEVRVVHSAEEGSQALGECDCDVILTDVNMPGMTGVELCRRVHERHEGVPVVVMTAYGTIESAVAAIRAGAYDFITKPFSIETFKLVVDRALGLNALQREATRLRARVSAVAPHLIGESDVMRRLRHLIMLLSDNESNVLVTGESGSGKELVARAIHDHGTRRAGPFVAINCAAMPEALLESELFGHARGAFTDAHSARPGLFVRAHRGTIFLDEIGEMRPTMQAKLLRAIQERTVRAVGADEEVTFDARIIAATHQDLKARVADESFREDLFYRLNVVQVHVPPLRARGDDVLVLARRFIAQLAHQNKRDVTGLSGAAVKALLAYPWPGNVRQLHNCIERAVAVASGRELTFEDLPDDVREYQPPATEMVATPDTIQAMPQWEEVEKRYIRQVLSAVAGNKTIAARILGLDRRTLYRKLEGYGEAPS